MQTDDDSESDGDDKNDNDEDKEHECMPYQDVMVTNIEETLCTVWNECTGSMTMIMIMMTLILAKVGI